MGATPQYPQDLQGLFNSPHFALTLPMMEQYNTAQKQAQQNLSLSEQLYAQNAANHPLDMENKKSLTRQHNATADNTILQSQQIKDAISTLPPADQRQAEAIAALRDKQTERERAAANERMKQLGQYAALGMANGGVVPLDVLQQVPEQYRSMLAAKGGPASAMKYLQLYNTLTPAYQQAMDVETLQGKTRIKVAEIGKERAVEVAGMRPGGGKNKGGSLQDKIDILEAKGDYQTLYSLASIAKRDGDLPEAARLTEAANSAYQRKFELSQAAAAKAAEKKIDGAALMAGKLGAPAAAAPVPQKVQLPAGWIAK